MQSASFHLCYNITLVMDRTADFYSRPSHDFRGGAGFHVFAGSRRQRGGSVLGSLKGLFMPIAKDLGKAAVATGVALAQDVVRDKMMGKNLKSSILEHGKARGLDFAKTAVKSAAKGGLLGKLTSMFGKGNRRASRRLRRKSLKRRRRRRRPLSRKTTSRKRRKRAKSAPKRNAKRRRIAVNF